VSATHVWLANPATGGVWECPNDEAVLAFYLARGWEPCDPPSDDDSVPEEPAAPVAPAPKKRTTK
jgi:hypothetical protein